MKIFLAYIPVPHLGYWKVFSNLLASGIDKIYLLGEDVLSDYPQLRKDLRALPPKLACQAINGWNLPLPATVITKSELSKLALSVNTLVLPDENLMRDIAERYGFSTEKLAFVSSFLRHTSENSLQPKSVHPDCEISEEEYDRSIMDVLFRKKRLASNWWRQVAACATRDGEIIAISCNTHVPTDYTPYIDGDPRADFKKGQYLECTTDTHAEPRIIGPAAKSGIPLNGSFLHVTTFPCDPCAKLVALTGFLRVYYTEGYTMIDGQQTLNDAGITIIRVVLEKPPP